MKIQLDTTNKTIKLDEDVLLSKLVETLNKLLPNKEWHKFTLQTNTVFEHWTSPIYIEKYIKPYEPYNTWQPWYWSSSSINDNKVLCENKAELKSGLYNVEI